MAGSRDPLRRELVVRRVEADRHLARQGRRQFPFQQGPQGAIEIVDHDELFSRSRRIRSPFALVVIQTVRPIGLLDGRVQDHLLEIQPDAPVLAAVEAPARHRPVRVDRAAAGRRDPCARSSRRRPGRSRTVGPGSSARCPRARPGATGRRAAGSRSHGTGGRGPRSRTRRRARSCTCRIPGPGTRRRRPRGGAARSAAALTTALPRVQLVDGDDPALAQQLDQRVQERRRFQRLALVGVEPRCGCRAGHRQIWRRRLPVSAVSSCCPLDCIVAGPSQRFV